MPPVPRQVARPQLRAGFVLVAALAFAMLPSLTAADGGPSAGGATVAAAVEPSAEVVVVAVGDIACIAGSSPTPTSCQQAATASAAAAIAPGYVLSLGDHQYEAGSLAQFQASYDASWGALKARTRPAVGNHEYKTPGAAGYFDYFGAAAGDRSKGYYSLDAGSWHIVALNSECQQVGGCGAGSPQETWLKNDLASSLQPCALAYWHKPRFSSSSIHPGNTRMSALWRALYNANAEVVLASHAHHYERFAPQTSIGALDNGRGLREFVVGPGGKSLYGLVSPRTPNSEVSNNTTFGVLRLTLQPGSYTWQFVPVAGRTFTDSGSTSCHGAGVPDTTPPSAPADLTATATASTQVGLTWTKSIDNVGVKGYRIYRDGALIATTGVTATFTDTTVAADTTYSFTVTAFDQTGRESAPSNAATVTTPPQAAGTRVSASGRR